jgi:Cof subfamily protein (haloacid dehalogenase superfamily)
MLDKLKKIKLIVIDIDGTLVDKNGRVGEKSLTLARQLKSQGIYCTLSSARSYHFSSHIADELEIDIPFITLDGALIKDRKHNVVFKRTLKENTIRRALKLADANYGKITVCDEKFVYVTPNNSIVREYSRLNAPIKEVNSLENIKDVLEILIYCEDKGSLRAIRNSFKFPYDIGLILNVTKSPSNDYYLLTIKRKGGDKLSSVKRLVKFLNLKKRNIAVIGDWHNDMPLFKYGAYNFAVKNAIPELKRRADYITSCTNNEDAVGEVLELVHNYKIKEAV